MMKRKLYTKMNLLFVKGFTVKWNFRENKMILMNALNILAKGSTKRET